MYRLKFWLGLIVATHIAHCSFADVVFFENMTIHFYAKSPNVNAYKFDGSENKVFAPTFNVSWTCSRDSDITLSDGIIINGKAITKELLNRKNEKQKAFNKTAPSYSLLHLVDALKDEPDIKKRHLLLLVSIGPKRDLTMWHFREIWSVFNKSWMVGSYLLDRLSVSPQKAIEELISSSEDLDFAKAVIALIERESERKKAIERIKNKFDLAADDPFPLSRQTENSECTQLEPESTDALNHPVETPAEASANAELLEVFKMMGGDPGRMKTLGCYALSNLSILDVETILQGFGGDSTRKEALNLILSELSSKDEIQKNIATIIATFKGDVYKYDALGLLELSQISMQDLVAIMEAHYDDTRRVKALKLIHSKFLEPAKQNLNNSIDTIMATFKGDPAKKEALDIFDISELSPKKIGKILQLCSGDYGRKSMLEIIVPKLSAAAKAKIKERPNKLAIIELFKDDQRRLDALSLLNQ